VYVYSTKEECDKKPAHLCVWTTNENNWYENESNWYVFEPEKNETWDQIKEKNKTKTELISYVDDQIKEKNKTKTELISYLDLITKTEHGSKLIFFMHGFVGSYQRNNQREAHFRFCKLLAQMSDRPVVMLDMVTLQNDTFAKYEEVNLLRSEHKFKLFYGAIKTDLEKVISTVSKKLDVTLIGYSFGGSVVMEYLSQNESLFNDSQNHFHIRLIAPALSQLLGKEFSVPRRMKDCKVIAIAEDTRLKPEDSNKMKNYCDLKTLEKSDIVSILQHLSLIRKDHVAAREMIIESMELNKTSLPLPLLSANMFRGRDMTTSSKKEMPPVRSGSKKSQLPRKSTVLQSAQNLLGGKK